MQAPTAAWPPTQPSNASARRPYSVWPSEVRGLAGQANWGVFLESATSELRGLKRFKPCLQIGDRVSLSSDRRGDEAQRRQCHSARRRAGAGLPVQGSLPLEALCFLGLDGASRAGDRWGGRHLRRGVSALKPWSLPLCVPWELWALGDSPLVAFCALWIRLPAVWCSHPLHFSAKLLSQGNAGGRSHALGSERPGLNPGFSAYHLCDPGLIIKCPAPGSSEKS